MRQLPSDTRHNAQGTYAPDLTHLMSRQTLASGIVPNTPENLRRWVADPQPMKPGCLMPAFGLTDRERNDIVDYLLNAPLIACEGGTWLLLKKHASKSRSGKGCRGRPYSMNG